MNPKKTADHNFSSFATGVSIGIIAALLFGTEEGRKIVKNALDAIPDKYKKIPDVLLPSDQPEAPRMPIITPEETPHHITYNKEAPPPPPPAVRPRRPL